jgi:hypothetical protein
MRWPRGWPNLGLPPAVAAALGEGPLHSLLKQCCAAERGGGRAGSLAACGVGIAGSTGSAVGVKRGRPITCNEGAEDEAGAGVSAAAAASAEQRPHKRARVRGSHNSALAEDGARKADASFSADSDKHFDEDGRELAAQATVPTRATVSARSTARKSSRPTSHATTDGGGALCARPRRAAGLVAGAAIRITFALETGAAFTFHGHFGDLAAPEVLAVTIAATVLQC